MGRLEIRDTFASTAAEAARLRLHIPENAHPILSYVLGTGWGDRIKLKCERGEARSHSRRHHTGADQVDELIKSIS